MSYGLLSGKIFLAPLAPKGGRYGGQKIFCPSPQNFFVQLPKIVTVCGMMSPTNRENLATCVRPVFELAYFNSDAPVWRIVVKILQNGVMILRWILLHRDYLCRFPYWWDVAFTNRSIENGSKRLTQKWRKITQKPTGDAIGPSGPWALYIFIIASHRGVGTKIWGSVFPLCCLLTVSRKYFKCVKFRAGAWPPSRDMGPQTLANSALCLDLENFRPKTLNHGQWWIQLNFHLWV